MEQLGIYIPRNGKPSVDTTNFKICQIVYSMFAYRNEESQNKEIVYSPLGNLLLDNLNNKKWVAKIFATMMYGMPFNHLFNRMRPDFNLYPLRLVFKLLTDPRLDYKIYEDEMFYHIFWPKDIDERKYEDLVLTLLEYRSLSTHKYQMCVERLSVQDTLANSLHETHYLFGQLHSAGIATIFEGSLVGTLRQGGFGRGSVPDFPSPEELAKHKPTGIRTYKTEGIRLNRDVTSLINKLLANYPYYEKPHDLLETLGRQDYILHLYNFYPQELLQELGVVSQSRIRTMLQITQDINRYSRNKEEGDCYKFEDVLADAFNVFDDVDAIH